MMQAPNVSRTVALRRAAFISLEVIERGLYGTSGHLVRESHQTRRRLAYPHC
jgi:hypothetical protein